MFSTTNKLEQSLLMAVTEPSMMSAFYQALLDSDVFILAYMTSPQVEQENTQGGGVADENMSQLMIQHWETEDGSKVIPFFTSEGFLQQAVGADIHFMAMNGGTFFEITQGTVLVLNPKSGFERFFSPDDISEVLAFSAPLLSSQEQSNPNQEQEITLSVPEQLPDSFINELVRLLSGYASVENAWLVEMQTRGEVNAPAHLLIGIETSEDINGLIKQSSLSHIVTALDTKKYSHVDFMEVTDVENEVINFIRNKVDPFYVGNLRDD